MTLDQTIMIVEAETRRQMEAVKRVERKTELSEDEKIRIGNAYKFYRAVTGLIETVKRDKAAMFGRMPPHADDVEEAVLGGCILESQGAVRNGKIYPPPLDRISGYLFPEHFYSERHRFIYSALLELPADKRELVGLHAKLRQNGHIEAVGGATYLVELTNKVSNTSNIEYHAHVLIDFAMKRRLIMLGSDLVSQGLDEMQDPHELFEKAKEELITLQGWTNR